MKAFETWWEQVRYEVPIAKHPLKAWQYYSHKAPHDVGKDIWRAALEWLQDTMKEIDEHGLPICGQEVIEQELEEVE